MNAELEVIILAYEAWVSARGPIAETRKAIYQDRLNDVLLRHHGLKRDKLEAAIRAKHSAWLKASHKNPTSIPPKA